MSTDLYGIRVLDVQPLQKKATIQLFVLYYDTANRRHIPLPQDISCFFRILADNSNPHYSDSPLGRSIRLDDYCNVSWVDNNAYRFITHVQPISQKNFPLRSYKGFSDFYVLLDTGWKEEEKLVQAVYEVYVTDAAYLTHLLIGSQWSTTAYETHAVQYYRLAEMAASLPDLLRPLFRINAASLLFTNPENGSTHLFFIQSIIFSNDGKILFIRGFVQSMGDEIIAWDTASNSLLWRSGILPNDQLNQQGVTHNGFVFWGDFCHITKVWDTVPPISKCSNPSPQGTFAATTNSKNLFFLDRKGKKTWKIDLPPKTSCVAYTPDEQRVVLAAPAAGYIAVWDITNRSEIKKIAIETATDTAISSPSFDPSGRFLLFLQGRFKQGGMLYILDVETEQIILRFKPPALNNNQQKQNIQRAAWSPCGRLIALQLDVDHHKQESSDYIDIFAIP